MQAQRASEGLSGHENAMTGFGGVVRVLEDLNETEITLHSARHCCFEAVTWHQIHRRVYSWARVLLSNTGLGTYFVP